MSAEDEQSQTGFDDGGAAGPGAPTPMSALEVSHYHYMRQVAY